MRRSVRAELIVHGVRKKDIGVEEVKAHLDAVANSKIKKITRELNRYCAGLNTPCGWCECCRVNRIINSGKLLDSNMEEVKNAQPIRYGHKARRRKKRRTNKK